MKIKAEVELVREDGHTWLCVDKPSGGRDKLIITHLGMLEWADAQFNRWPAEKE